MIIPAGVFEQYGFRPPDDLKRFGSGLIHDTYYFTREGHEYLIQRLNHHIFKDLDGMMSNIDKVETFIKQKYPGKIFVSFLRTRSGSSYLKEEDQYWRLMIYIKDSKSYDQVSDIKYAFEAGKIIGDFHSSLDTFDASQLVETIPHFHDFSLRSEAFGQAQQLDVCARAKLCAQEIRFLNEMVDEINQLQTTFLLPTRVTHNDTKLNNILFDQKDKAICLVDLDTLMPGKVIFDTGDALRTMCNPAGEDGSQGIVAFDKEIFYQFSKGFIQSTHAVLTLQEIQLLPFSVVRMCTEQGIRFLTDYLQGDIYYRQPFPGFNLKGTQVQIELLKEVKRNEQWMDDQIVRLIESKTQFISSPSLRLPESG